METINFHEIRRQGRYRPLSNRRGLTDEQSSIGASPRSSRGLKVYIYICFWQILNNISFYKQLEATIVHTKWFIEKAAIIVKSKDSD